MERARRSTELFSLGPDLMLNRPTSGGHIIFSRPLLSLKLSRDRMLGNGMKRFPCRCSTCTPARQYNVTDSLSIRNGMYRTPYVGNLKNYSKFSPFACFSQLQIIRSSSLISPSLSLLCVAFLTSNTF